MTHAHTGPRPQRHEIVAALDDLASGILGALVPHVPIVGEVVEGALKSAAHEQGLRLLERLGVDTASVRVTADQAPHLVVTGQAPPRDVERR